MLSQRRLFNEKLKGTESRDRDKVERNTLMMMFSSFLLYFKFQDKAGLPANTWQTTQDSG